MKLFRKTKEHKKYWEDRKIDWSEHYLNVNHPHRFVIIDALKDLEFGSIIEVGCAAGANLINVVKYIPNRMVGGVDLSEDAINTAKSVINGAMLKVGSGDNLPFGDKMTDIVLTDMALIYVSPKDIDKYIKEIKRIGRNYVVLCEFHSNSLLNRLSLKYNTGYNAHDYKRLLSKHGFYDIFIYKLKEKEWPGGNPQKTFGHVIIAKIPRR